MNYTKEDFKEIIDGIRSSSVTIEDSPDPRVEDKIINKYMDGDCMDTIRREMKMPYDDVEEILTDAGLI